MHHETVSSPRECHRARLHRPGWSGLTCHSQAASLCSTYLYKTAWDRIKHKRKWYNQVEWVHSKITTPSSSIVNAQTSNIVICHSSVTFRTQLCMLCFHTTGSASLWHQRQHRHGSTSFAKMPVTLKGDRNFSAPLFSLKIFVLIILERKGEGEKHRLVPPIYGLIGWSLHVPWLGIEPAALARRDDALTNWTTWPGLHVSLRDYCSICGLSLCNAWVGHIKDVQKNFVLIVYCEYLVLFTNKP